MTPFEYLAVLISIVLGLGVTELLFGTHRLFFLVVAAATLLEMFRAFQVADLQAAGLNLAATLLLGSLSVVRSPRYHAVGTVLAALLLAAFVIAETLRIA